MRKPKKKYVFRRVACTLGAIVLLGGGSYFVAKKVVEKEAENKSYNRNGIEYVMPINNNQYPVQDYYIINNEVVADYNFAAVNGNTTYAYATGDVNIHRKASISSTVKGVLPAGKVLPYVEKGNGNYLKVYYNGEYGYIDGNYALVMSGAEYAARVNTQAQVLPTPTATPVPTQEPVVTPAPYNGPTVNDLYYVVATSNVHIRQAANRESQIYDDLKKGAGLIYLGQYNQDWYLVEFNGKLAYISTEFSKLMTAAEYQASITQETATPVMDLYYVVANTGVNVRAYPSTEDNIEIYTTLKQDSGLIYLGQLNNDWYTVEYNGKVGYVSTKYSRLLNAADYQALVDSMRPTDEPYRPTPTVAPTATPVPTQAPVTPANYTDADVPEQPTPALPVMTPELYTDPSLYVDGLRTLNDLTDVTFVTATTGVNVRAMASSDDNSEILTTLKTGKSLRYIDQLNADWYVVEYMGQTAFVSTHYSQLTTQKAFPYGVQFYAAMEYDGTLFDQQGNNIYTIPQNELVAVYGQDDGYYLVETEGHFGYVNSKFCKRLDGTFVVTDISDQTVTLYVNGMPCEEYPCVTGNVNAGTPTTEGLFEINAIIWDTVLKSTKYNYESPVDVYIRYYGGQGYHDAEHHTCNNGTHGWRGHNDFGGTTYINNGSHGCTNMRHDDAVELANSVSVGNKVLVKR